jgi:hypothetical protein
MSRGLADAALSLCTPGIDPTKPGYLSLQQCYGGTGSRHTHRLCNSAQSAADWNRTSERNTKDIGGFDASRPRPAQPPTRKWIRSLRYSQLDPRTSLRPPDCSPRLVARSRVKSLDPGGSPVNGRASFCPGISPKSRRAPRPWRGGGSRPASLSDNPLSQKRRGIR